MNNVGLQLQRLRTDKGISLRKLSEMTRINHSNLQRIESGQLNATLETLNKITTALEANIIIKPLERI